MDFMLIETDEEFLMEALRSVAASGKKGRFGVCVRRGDVFGVLLGQWNDCETDFVVFFPEDRFETLIADLKAEKASRQDLKMAHEVISRLPAFKARAARQFANAANN